MSGHTSYTIWITYDAKYLKVGRNKEKITNTFFTSDPMPNSDIFNIRTEDGCYELGDNKVDWYELIKRYKL